MSFKGLKGVGAENTGNSKLTLKPTYQSNGDIILACNVNLKNKELLKQLQYIWEMYFENCL